MSSFIDTNPSISTYWRSIILLGRNVASYKFALAKTLIEIPKNDSLILLEDLALPFAKNISEHMKICDKQITSSSSKFLDFCKKYNDGEICDEKLKENAVKLGFVNVIDAFHNVAGNELPRFFEDSRKNNNGIRLTDNFYCLLEDENNNNLNSEINSRWRLWETAISLNVSPHLIEIKSDKDNNLLFVKDKERRIDVTSSKDALNGYQKGKCFYCRKKIVIESGFDNSCDVDHFFPFVLKRLGLKQINQVWNLVLTCKECNRGTGGKFEKIPQISYLDSLLKRNNFYIESHHPLRETILNQMGKSEIERRSFLQNFYDLSTQKIPSTIKWKPSEYFGTEL